MSPRRPAADRNAPAFTEAEARELLKPLAACRRVALAVSGGPDSVGLMLLATTAKLGEQATVLTVDHGLRPQSGAEAERVAEWARKLGFDAEVLRWEGPKPKTAVQERAREARYRLMADWCTRHGADAVATGHTLDDQAETLLMRLARGSGVDGLSAMPATTMRHGVRILRPLLNVERRRLIRLAAESGHDFIADPSNDDPAFERVRIRNAAAVLNSLGLKPGALGLAARRLQRARVALDAATDRLEAAAVTVAPEMYAVVDMSVFEQAAEELRIRLLSRLLATMGGDSEAADLSQVERAGAWLSAGKGGARTLGGCRIHRRSTSFLVGREGGRMFTTPVAVAPGQTVLFDGRFRVHVERAPPGSLRLEALGKTTGPRPERPASLPAFVFETLPAVIHDGEVAAVPHLGFRREGPNGAVLAEVKPSIAWASEFLYDSANLATDRRVLMLH